MQKLLGLIEQHIEKGILGLCVLFTLYVAWGYLLGSPNKIEFQGEQVGPGELQEKIASAAQSLEQRVRTATPNEEEVEDVPDYTAELEQEFKEGLFARDADTPAPPLAERLLVTTGFGSKIEVPGLEQEEESVELVRPLAPSDIVARVGRSMVYKQALPVGFGDDAAAADDDDLDAVEQPWVTIAGYFDRKAQYQEMISAGYAPYRARVYVVGIDVRRQEVQSDGTFSEPEVVSRSTAMPALEVPEPIFDDEDGSLANKPEIDEAFRTIKAQQALLQQPPFYYVDAGDFWEVPPLDGLFDEELAIEDEEEEPVAAPSRVAPTRRTGGLGPASGGRGGLSGGRGGLSGGRGGLGGGAAPRPSAAQNEAQERAAARRAIRDTLEDAQKALMAKDFRRAIDLAAGISTQAAATTTDKKKADAIVQRATRLEAKANRLAGAGGGLPPRASQLVEVVENPETGAPAVWFHDDEVESGKTYRYSMRVKLWNRYVGQTRAMKDPKDARQPVLTGEWSEWGPPVTVTPDTYFFVAGEKPGAEVEAMVEVWKWRKGQWMSERFDVKVGDVIGGVKTVKTNELDEDLRQVRADVDFTTGAVVLDLRADQTVPQRIPGKDAFSYRPQDSVVIVYLDPADGQVKEKAAVLDRNDPLRKRLEEAEL